MTPDNFSLITTLVLVFISALGGGILAKKLKLPSVIGYIGVGVALGNIFPGFTDRPFLELIADVGVTLLLFTLGVEFSFHRLRQVLPTVGLAAVVQILVTVVVFWLGVSYFGFSFVPALFIAAASSLSSTAVVVKIFSERGETDTLPATVSSAWLVVQDIAVVPMMIILPAIAAVAGGGQTSFIGVSSTLLVSVAKSAIYLGVVLLLGRSVIPKVLDYVASLRSRELLLVSVVGLVFLGAVGSFALGLPAPLGAFIAGLLVAETSQNHAIFAEVRPLRDVFAVVFFVALGFVIPISVVMTKLSTLISLTAVVVFVKLCIVLVLMRFLGYHRKTAFLVALSLTQISEFGFVIAQEGRRIGFLTPDQEVFLIALTILTIAITSPLIARSHGIYYWLSSALWSRWPKLFPVKTKEAVGRQDYPIEGHIVICGYGRVGKYIGRALEMAGIPFLVVDYNHHTVKELQSRGVHVVFGDPAEKEVLDYAQVDLARAIIIAIPDRHTQEMIISHAQTLNRRIRIICRTHFEEDQKILKSLGVDSVVQPEFEAALSIVEKILSDFGVASEKIAGKIGRLKIEHGLG